jgi:hypothetical protein
LTLQFNLKSIIESVSEFTFYYFPELVFLLHAFPSYGFIKCHLISISFSTFLLTVNGARQKMGLLTGAWEKIMSWMHAKEWNFFREKYAGGNWEMFLMSKCSIMSIYFVNKNKTEIESFVNYFLLISAILRISIFCFLSATTQELLP